MIGIHRRNSYKDDYSNMNVKNIIMREPKRILKILILINLIISMANCNYKDEIRFKSFPIEVEIASTTLPLNKNYHNSFIAIVDSLLLIICPYSTTNFVHIYNKNNLQHIKSFCHKGKGPNEISMIGPYSLDKKNKNFWIVDFSRNSVWKYALDSLLKNLHYEPVITRIPRDFYPIMSIANFNSESLIVPDPLGKHLVSIFNSDGKLLKNFGLKNFQGVRSNGLFSELSRFHISIHPEKEKLVVVYRHVDIISVYDLNNEDELISLLGPDKIEIKNQLKLSDGELITAYDGVAYLCDDYIFAPYHGKLIFTISDNNIDIVYPNEIHVFNWEYEPVMKLILDHQFCSFVVDRPNGRLIAFAVDSEENIVSYDIEQLLETNK